MDILEYQDQAQRTLNKELEYKDLLQNLLLGLNGEVGELTDLYKKILYHNHSVMNYSIEEEIGDVLWYILNLITIEGFSIEKILIQNIEKLKKRYPNGFNSDDSIKRVDVKEVKKQKLVNIDRTCFNQHCEHCHSYSLLCQKLNLSNVQLCEDYLSRNIKSNKLKEELPIPKLNLNNTNSQHYKNYIIEPFEYIHANKLNFFEGCIIKYVTRHKEKNGIEDLKKAKDYLNFLIENYQKVL